MKKITTLMMAFAVLLFAAQLTAGVEYKVDVKDYSTSTPETDETTVLADGKKLKMKAKKDANDEMIFRGDKREMVVVDHKEKSYMVINKEVIAEMGKKMQATVDQSMSQVNEALKNLPADKRAMVEKMMKEKMPNAGAAPPPPPTAGMAKFKSEFKNTGERGMQNGYSSIKYEVYRDGKKTHEHWVTSWDNIEGGEDTAEILQEMSAFFQEMMDAFSSSTGMGGMGNAPFQMDENMFASLKSLEGFPVVTKDFANDGSLEGESALRSATRRTIDPDEFEPPAGYRLRTMMDMR